jgi:hypothetical protein
MIPRGNNVPVMEIHPSVEPATVKKRAEEFDFGGKFGFPKSQRIRVLNPPIL